MAPKTITMTPRKNQVLRALDDAPPTGLYVSQISTRTELPSNAVSSILAQFVEHGWVTRHWDTQDDRRRFYHLTDVGRDHVPPTDTDCSEAEIEGVR